MRDEEKELIEGWLRLVLGPPGFPMEPKAPPNPKEIARLLRLGPIPEYAQHWLADLFEPKELPSGFRAIIKLDARSRQKEAISRRDEHFAVEIWKLEKEGLGTVEAIRTLEGPGNERQGFRKNKAGAPVIKAIEEALTPARRFMGWKSTDKN